MHMKQVRMKDIVSDNILHCYDPFITSEDLSLVFELNHRRIAKERTLVLDEESSDQDDEQDEQSAIIDLAVQASVDDAELFIDNLTRACRKRLLKRILRKLVDSS